MMKDIMSKLAELEATAPKIAKKKMLSEDSTTPPMNVSDKPASLKDMFEMLSETVQPGQKPLPVLDPQHKQSGMGFVTSSNPAVQNMLKNLDPKDVQIVQAPGQQQQQQQQQTGQPAPAGATGQPQQGQMQMKEKWDTETKVSPSEKGKYAGKSKAELTSQYNKLKASGPHKKGSPEFGKMRELAFAIRAKSDWGKVQEEDMDEGMLSKAALGLAGAAALAGGAHAASPGKTRIDPVNPHSKVTRIDPVNKKSIPVKINPVNKRSIPVRVDLEEKLTKSMSAGDIIKDFEKSKDPKFKGKSKEERKKQALGAYYGMHPEKSKKKVKEADFASTQGIDTKGAGLGAGRSQTTLEAKEPQVEVIDNAFNRENYKDLIGKKYPKSKAPAYARVKEISEGAKPDFLDLDKDGNKKEPMKKAAADKKKKKVDESMNHRISAARLEGKSHGLRGHAHSGKRYEDLEELKAYHEGYKEGLDECYGQGVYENAPATPPATVGGMADGAMDEGNAFTAALAKTPKGGKFSVGGKTFTDRTGYDAKIDEYAFESLDNQLNALLESEEVTEGLSVSVSKGQQNSPDSVTITAQDQEADQLLQLVKHAGLGLFGDDHAEPSSAMSIQPTHGAPDEVGAGGVDVEVVDGHDGIMGLMQKLSGIQADGANDADYADEEGHKDCGCSGDCDCNEKTDEAMCNECGGMMEAGHSCGSKEMVDEVESEDQMEFEVSEDNAPDSGAEDSVADENAEAKEDADLAGVDADKEEEMNESFLDLLGRLNKLVESSEEDEEDEEEEDVTEDAEEDTGDSEGSSEDLTEWANQVGKGPGKGTDASFEQDIDFMTKVIAGGLNKPKSTGQTTVPVIAGQDERMHDNPRDWATLAGIKK